MVSCHMQNVSDVDNSNNQYFRLIFSWTFHTQLPEPKSSSKSSMSTNFVSFTKSVWAKRSMPIFSVMNGRDTFCVSLVETTSRDSQWNRVFSHMVSYGPSIRDVVPIWMDTRSTTSIVMLSVCIMYQVSNDSFCFIFPLQSVSACCWRRATHATVHAETVNANANRSVDASSMQTCPYWLWSLSARAKLKFPD